MTGFLEAGADAPDTPPTRNDTGGHHGRHALSAGRGGGLPHGVPPLLGARRPLTRPCRSTTSPGRWNRSTGSATRTGSASAPTRCTSWPPTPGGAAAAAVYRSRRRGGVRAAVDHRGAAGIPPGVAGAVGGRRGAGTTTVWVAFHGIGVEHDRQVNRPGAFTETCLAVQRVHAAGLRAGCNVFVTSANAGQADRLLGALQRLQVDGMAWEPATYYPTPRGRRDERLRPEPPELLPFADRVRQASLFHVTHGRTSRPTPKRLGRVARWPATGQPGPATPATCWSWCAAPALTCTPAWLAGTASGMATCGPTMRMWCLAARSNKVGATSRRCGLVPTRCRQLLSWPPAMPIAAGSESTSARTRSATCGWTARSEPDARRPSPARSALRLTESAPGPGVGEPGCRTRHRPRRLVERVRHVWSGGPELDEGSGPQRLRRPRGPAGRRGSPIPRPDRVRYASQSTPPAPTPSTPATAPTAPGRTCDPHASSATTSPASSTSSVTASTTCGSANR